MEAEKEKKASDIVKESGGTVIPESPIKMDTGDLIDPVSSFEACDNNFRVVTKSLQNIAKEMRSSDERTNANLTRLAEETKASVGSLAGELRQILSTQAFFLMMVFGIAGGLILVATDFIRLMVKFWVAVQMWF